MMTWQLFLIYTVSQKLFFSSKTHTKCKPLALTISQTDIVSATFNWRIILKTAELALMNFASYSDPGEAPRNMGPH